MNSWKGCFLEDYEEQLLTLRFLLLEFYMKRFFPFFFLLIMALNVALPIAERLFKDEQYELSAMNKDKSENTGEEKKTEKEKEKESITFSDFMAIRLDGSSDRRKKSVFPADERLISELFAFLPELPPEV